MIIKIQSNLSINSSLWTGGASEQVLIKHCGFKVEFTTVLRVRVYLRTSTVPFAHNFGPISGPNFGLIGVYRNCRKTTPLHQVRVQLYTGVVIVRTPF